MLVLIEKLRILTGKLAVCVFVLCICIFVFVWHVPIHAVIMLC